MNNTIPDAQGNSELQRSLLIHVTTFPNTSAREKKPRELTWPVLVNFLSEPKEHPSKEACPLLKLAKFGDNKTPKGSLRSDENMESVFGIEGDYDDERVSVAQAADMLRAAGIEAFIYTSPRHTPQRPRWRVLAPLSKPHLPGERRQLVGMLNYALGGILATESFTPSQTYYFGKVKGSVYETAQSLGAPIDTLDLILDCRYPDKATKDPAAGTPKTGEPDSELERMSVLAAVNDETIADLRSALMGMDPDRANDRARWIAVLESLASLKATEYAEQARELAHEFSKRCPEKYDAEYLDGKWEGMNPDRITFRSIFEGATDDGWQNPKSAAALRAANEYTSLVDRTDTGNANLLSQITEGNLRYVPDRRLWLWWQGERWIADQHGSAAQSAAQRVAQHYHEQATELDQKARDKGLSEQERKRVKAAAESVAKWATHCRNKRPIDAMLSIASKDTRLQVTVAEMDSGPWLFGVANGVIDLRTGTLRPAARDDFVTKRSPVRFNPAAGAPRWLEFIDEITGTPDATTAGKYTKRAQLTSYLHRALGYSLTGSVAEQKMFISIGAGSNGKNVLLDMLQWIMGDYCQTIPPETLMAARHDVDAERPSPTAATLAGARAAISSESKDGQRLDVALVKRHTGGGYMTARLMRENSFRFDITHKLWLMTNHRPALDHLDDAMRGRLHLIPFDRKWNRPGHPERDSRLPDGDKDLIAKLKAEAEGVLAWLVAGAVAYAQDGLEPPPEVARMTRDYFNDQDALGRWLEGYEACDPKSGGKAAELFEAFETWCSEEGLDNCHPNTQKAFSEAVLARGHQKQKLNDGIRYGLRVRRNGVSTVRKIA